MEGLVLPLHAARVPMNVSALSIFDGPPLCAQAAAVCGRGNGAAGKVADSRVIVVNRCQFPTVIPIGDACGGQAGWKSAESFNASLAMPGSMWARLTEDWHPLSGPMRASRRLGGKGKGTDVVVDPLSLTVVLL